MLVKRSTAEKLKQLIAAKPATLPVPASQVRDRATVLVKCTSATAAAGSGVGAQCYPGIIVDPHSDATTQDTLGTVWLTVLGAGGLAKKPASGVVYECLLTGDIEAATADIRPRAFATLGAAFSSADCSSWLGLLRLGTCATLAVTEVDGACACVTVQSTTLTWDDDADALVSPDDADDYLYGCPPGVFTSLCPDGAPRKWSSLFAGFTGVYAILNGGWTWTYTAGNTWVATKSGITATLVMTAGLAYTITFSGGTSAVNALQYTVSGDTNCCDAVTLTKV